jgi:hypothetical protein
MVTIISEVEDVLIIHCGWLSINNIVDKINERGYLEVDRSQVLTALKSLNKKGKIDSNLSTERFMVYSIK